MAREEHGDVRGDLPPIAHERLGVACGVELAERGRGAHKRVHDMDQEKQRRGQPGRRLSHPINFCDTNGGRRSTKERQGRRGREVV